MRIGVIADVHVGNHRQHGGPMQSSMNARCRETIRVLERAANDFELDHLVIAGDLLDDVKPLPQVLTAVRAALGNQSTVIMNGNHETVSDAVGDHALGPLMTDFIAVFTGAMFCPVEEGRSILYLPFRREHPSTWYAAEVQRLAEASRRAGHEPIAAVSHFGIYDDGMLAAAQYDITASAMYVGDVHEACRVAGVKLALSGDWHYRQRWDFADGRTVVQIGALVPTGWDNPGSTGYGSIWTFDSNGDKLDYIELAGPRFVSVSTLLDAEHEIKLATARGQQVYVRAHGKFDERAKLVSGMQTLEHHAGLAAWEYVPERLEQEQKALAAATTARAQPTLGTALAAYVAKMQMPAGVDGRRVLERCRKYLGATE